VLQTADLVRIVRSIAPHRHTAPVGGPIVDEQ
jgi:hypothetical protein